MCLDSIAKVIHFLKNESPLSAYWRPNRVKKPSHYRFCLKRRVRKVNEVFLF